jgi:hypothetical protein
VIILHHGAPYRQLPRFGPAKWRKDNHECAPTQTSSVTCCTLEAVDIGCRPPRAEEFSKRAKKLSALSGIARAETQIGNTVGAENYYQYAEHYFRSMRSDPEGM